MNIKGCFIIPVLALTIFSCSDDKDITEAERRIETFQSLLGGEYSTLQWWQTAVKLRVSVKTQAPAGVYAYFVGEDGGTLFDYKYVTKDSTF